MSGFLVNKSLLDPTVTQYSGGTASFTLPQSGSTNATEVFVGGVPQVAGVDFNISGTALTLTTSAPAGSNMVCARQYFSDGITGTPASNSVATAAIQNDAVTVGKLSGGVLTDGFAATDFDLGTNTTGTETLDYTNGNFQKGVNGGAHTLAPQATTSTIIVQYTNNASAGTLTTSGYTIVTGDSLTTTDGHDFMIYSTRVNGFKHLHVVALQ